MEHDNPRDRAWRALPLFAVAAMFAIASPVLAQNNPLGQAPSTPPRPFQEKGTGTRPAPPGLLTPQTFTDGLETWAKEDEGKQLRPSERQHFFGTSVPRDVAEFEALGRYALLILTVVTQRADELPLKRVYLRMPDRELPVLKIASWRRNVDQTLATYKMYGPYREDGFYLFPFSAYLRIAQLQTDFATNRLSLPLLDFPHPRAPEWLKTLQNPDPLPGALPNLRALQDFIRSRTSGFPIPTSLPQVTPEKPAKREPVMEGELPTPPELQNRFLKDLFKK
jgi:hypothetical protein